MTSDLQTVTVSGQPLVLLSNPSAQTQSEVQWRSHDVFIQTAANVPTPQLEQVAASMMSPSPSATP